jgi:hypothetical protein
MNPEIKAYQEFIDLLVTHRFDTIIRAIKEADLADTPYQRSLQQVLETLTPEQREIIGNYVQDRFVVGMQKTLFLMDMEDYKVINPDGINITGIPYSERMHYDFLWRVEGGNWEDTEED